LLVWGAFCHWRDQREGADVSASLYLRLGVFVTSFGFAILCLGHYHQTGQALSGILPFFAASYALVPAAYQLIRRQWHFYPARVSFAAWFAVAFALYGGGLFNKAAVGENYFFTFGGMAAVLALRALLLTMKPWLDARFNTASNYIYGGAGSVYFSGAIVMLLLTATMLTMKLEPIAEQLAVIVYYCLVVGTVKELIALRGKQDAEAPNPA